MKKKIGIVIILIIIGILLLGMLFFAVDSYRIKNDKPPIFAVQYSVLRDGGTTIYIGLGYKIIDYNVIDGNDKTYIGSYFMKYEDYAKENLEINYNETDKVKNTKYVPLEQLPKEYKESLEIKAVSGDVEVEENLKFEDLTIASTSGDIKMGNVEAKNIKIESISGDIKLGDLIDEDLRLKTVSGDIRVESAKGKIEAKTTSGTIEIKELEGNVELTSVSGDVKSDDFKVTGTSRVKTTSGNVRMYLNQESNCEIQTKSVSGNVTLPNRRNVMGVEPYAELNIETVSGNIRLEK